MPPQYYFEKEGFSAIYNSTRVALLLDFDGTLLSIRKNPEECYLSPDTQKLLELILNSGKSVVAILSGRSLSDLRRRLHLRGAFYAGSHGLEISGPGIRFVHQSARLAKPAINNILQDLKKELDGCEGVRIEEKPYSFALHYRETKNDIVPFIRRTFYRMTQNNPANRRTFAVMRGKKVLEILPRISWNKGTAALHIIERLQGSYLPVCVGDDRTDESLF